LKSRRVHHTHKYTGRTDLAVIGSDLWHDAIDVENGMRFELEWSRAGVKDKRKILAGQHLIAWDVIQELAESGMDWTVTLRRMSMGQAALPTEPIGLLLDGHFAGEPDVEVDGQLVGSNWGVRGQGGGDGPDPVWNERTNAAALADYGLVERVVTVDAITDSKTAGQAAAMRSNMLGEAVAILKGGTLAQSAPVTIHDLIPGVILDVSLDHVCYPVAGRYRLRSVNVRATSDGKEAVEVTFQPVGALAEILAGETG
jgi:hypothetical protein